jgi:hypothetical protein
MFIKKADHPPDEASGAIDPESTKTQDTTLYPAVAQVVVLDPNRAERKDDDLIVQAIRLSARRFIDGYPLEPDPKTDLYGFMNQYTVFGHTATLIRKNVALTAGHAILPNQLGSTYLIFGRVLSADPSGPDRVWLTIPKSRWVRVKAIHAMRKPRYNKATKTWSGSDWALLELAEDVTKITPIALAAPGATFSATNTVVVSHPMGLPRKRTEVKKLGSQPSSLLTDFASGASGSPVLVDGKLWGLMEGKARFKKDDIAVGIGGKKVIRVQSVSDAEATDQPITTLDTIRAELKNSL